MIGLPARSHIDQRVANNADNANNAIVSAFYIIDEAGNNACANVDYDDDDEEEEGGGDDVALESGEKGDDVAGANEGDDDVAVDGEGKENNNNSGDDIVTKTDATSSSPPEKKTRSSDDVARICAHLHFLQLVLSETAFTEVRRTTTENNEKTHCLVLRKKRKKGYRNGYR